MLDIKFIRENTEKVKKAIRDRGMTIDLDDLLRRDKERTGLLQEVEKLRAERNQLADVIAKLPKDARHDKIAEGKKIREELVALDKTLHATQKAFEEELSRIPNIPAEDVPVGGEEKNTVIRKVGDIPNFDFQPRDHLDLGQNLGMIDIERATKVSGARFTYLKGDGVLLEFALVQFALDTLGRKGLTPIMPPMLIKKQITDDLGYWHGGGNENYYLVRDYNVEGEKDDKTDFYLVGTGEHSIAPMHRNEVFQEKDLPLRYVGFSSCFRREAGSYGKDTRGILRLHQFDKVEMISFVRPADDGDEHKRMLGIAEELMQALQLPYRVVLLSTGDIGFPTAKTYDIETWMPSQKKYRETHSISTTTDFQARRLHTKVKTKNQMQFVHILNGTAFAIGRTIIAILENFQQKDGSVVVPEVLRPYLKKDVLRLTK